MADTVPTAPAEARTRAVKGEVAKGRMVVTDKGNKGPGETVVLPADEIAWLISRGFLVDPDADPVKEANGPTFDRV